MQVRDKGAALLIALLVAVTLMLGATSAAAVWWHAQIDTYREAIARLEADVRAAHGKRYDEQERHEAEMEVVRNDANLKAWKAESELEVCVKRFERMYHGCGGEKK